jgi:hypothetical protein
LVPAHPLLAAAALTYSASQSMARQQEETTVSSSDDSQVDQTDTTVFICPYLPLDHCRKPHCDVVVRPLRSNVPQTGPAISVCYSHSSTLAHAAASSELELKRSRVSDVGRSLSMICRSSSSMHYRQSRTSSSSPLPDHLCRSCGW